MINTNLLVNVLLLGAKGGAILLSNSISLLASFVDSALDLLSTLIIFVSLSSLRTSGVGGTVVQNLLRIISGHLARRRKERKPI